MVGAETIAGGHGRPEIDSAEAVQLLARHYAIDADLTELGSQEDRNFLARADRGRFVLKIFGAGTDCQNIEEQIAAMAALAAAGITAPTPVPGTDGALIRTMDCAGVEHRAVLLTFVEGEQLVDVGYLPPHLTAGLAALVARVCTALAAVPVDPDRISRWDLRHARTVVNELAGHVDPDHREALLALTEQAWSTVSALAADLVVQTAHGDLTDDNIVVRPDADGVPEIVGVIDFGDLGQSWRVGELAVALAAMLHHDLDDLGVLAEMVATFDREQPLSDVELAALWPLVQLRCAVLVAAGWQQLDLDPGNTYAQERTEHERRCLEVAARCPAPVMTALFTAATRGPAPASAGPQLLAVEGPDGAAPTLLCLGPDSDDVPTGLLLRADTEQAVLEHALGAHPLLVFPQGEYRATRSVANLRPDRQEVCSLWAQTAGRVPHRLVARADLRVEAITADQITVTGTDGTRILICGAVPADGLGVGSTLGPGAVLAAAGRTDAAAVADATGTTDATGTAVDAVGVMSSGPADGDDRYGLTVVATGPTLEVPVRSFCTPDLAPGWRALTRDTNAVLGIDAVIADPADADRAEYARRTAFLPDNTERYYVHPPQIERGLRSHLIDSGARVHLDLVNNVAGLGHSHPALTEAVSRALSRLNTNSRFLYRQMADLAERLLTTTGSDAYDSVIFVNSGTEAVDLALRMAQLATGHTRMITHREGYHGWSVAADAVSTSAFDNPAAADTRPDWVHVVASPNPYRGAHRGADAGARYTADVAADVEAMVAAGDRPAGILMEGILGNSGGVLPPPGYFAAVAEIVRAAGGISIADEVQVGFGRTGDTFWASRGDAATPDFAPDILVSAKAMGNGFPIGAVITRREISDALGREGHFFSTTGGSPAACAAGLAVLDVMEREQLMANARETGAYLNRSLTELAAAHPLIGALHGKGFYQGIELVRDVTTLEPADTETARICEALLPLGVVDQATSERQNVLKVKPPMTLTRADADFYVQALDGLLQRKWH